MQKKISKLLLIIAAAFVGCAHAAWPDRPIQMIVAYPPGGFTDSLARARAIGLSPLDMLANNDGHGFFGALGDAVITGPTLTNVNDFRILLIDSES